MSFRAALLVTLCLAAATSGAAAQAGDAGQPSWTQSVRSRVAEALAGVRGRRLRGSSALRFTVTADGHLVGVVGQGDRRLSEAGAAALRRLGRVDAPPDHRLHPMSILVNEK